MPIYKVKLKGRQEIAAGTMAFHFEKPEGFAYNAGQFADYTLIAPAETDAEGNTRGFSLASAPYEDYLMLATRMRDTAFKRDLKVMEPSTELTLLPQQGEAFVIYEGGTETLLKTGSLYHGGVTPVFGIQNRAEGPFQMLVLLVRATAPAE